MLRPHLLPLIPLFALTLLSAGCNIPFAPAPSASVSPAQADSPTITARKNHLQGPLKSSPKATDWGIDGPGYFEVRDRSNNKTYYTRNGAFEFSAKGELITHEGYALQPPITLTDAKLFSHVNEGGAVWIKEAGQYSTQGRITIIRFAKPDKLKALGGRDAYFEATPAAGRADTFQPKQNGAGFIIGSALEDFSFPAAAVPERGCKNASRLDLSGSKMDFAIEGKGFFTYLDPATGERYFSRRASLKVNSFGQLLSEHGYPLDPAITLPPGQSLDRIESDGSVWSIGGGSALRLGQLSIALPAKPTALVPLGFTRGANYLAPLAAGQIQDLKPGSGGTGFIRSGTLENCGQEVISLPEDFISESSALSLTN